MSTIYTHVPHPHIENRKLHGPVKTVEQRNIDHPNPFVRFNARFGLGITVVVGTMWCAYIFTTLAVVSLPSAIKSGDTITIVSWIAQTFLQLVLLPIIIVGQNIQGKASDKRGEDTYKDAEAVLHEALQIQEHLAAQDAELEKLAQLLRARA